MVMAVERAPLAAIRLLRPHQWVKNGFVAAPLFFTPNLVNPANIAAVALGIVAFCFLSSAVYIVNDYVDREADRKHPEKRQRPLAAGTVSVATAAAMLLALLIAGLAIAYAISVSFALYALVYLGLNAVYSLWLKHAAPFDVILIAVGFVVRVEAGGAIIGVVPSAWMVIVTGLLALFLALAKRRDDIVRGVDRQHRKSLGGYTKPFLDAAITFVLGALLVAYLIYTTDADVMQRMGTDRLFITAPFVVLGILRYLQIIFIEERSGAPTVIVLTDRTIQLAVLCWIGTFAALLYA